MSAVLAMIARDVRSHRNVFIAGLVAAVASTLVAILHSPIGGADSRALLPMVTAGFFTAAMSILLGASAIASGLADGRIAFYFNLPISPVRLWFTKVAGAALVAITSGGLIAVPAIMIGARPVDVLERLPIILAAILNLILLSHLVSTSFRSRSLWLAVDAVAGALFLSGAFIVFTAIALHASPWMSPIGRWLVPALFVVAASWPIVALFIAGAVQLSVGRTDIRRSHRTLSVVTWSLLSLPLLVLGAWIAVAASRGPASLFFPIVDAASADGVRTVVSGTVANGYSTAFLYDSMTGQSVPVSADATISADGSRAIWHAYEVEWDGTVRSRLISGSLRDSEVNTKTLKGFTSAQSLWGPRRMERSMISPDGRLALIDADRSLSIVDIDRDAVVATVQLDREDLAAICFVGPSTFRVYGRRDPTHVTIRQVDARSGEVRETGSIVVPGSRNRGSLAIDPSHRRLLLSRADGRTLHDAADGRLIAALPDRGAARFLDDGRIVIVSRSGIAVFSAEGTLVRQVPNPITGGMILPAQPAPDMIWMTANDARAPGAGLASVDLRTGQSRTIGRVRGPAIWWLPFGYSIRSGSLPTRLFTDVDGTIVTIDPTTGARKPLRQR